MPEDQPCPADHPLMKAWEVYRQSEEYLNSFKWAANLEHRTGSMWAAFDAGFAAASERQMDIETNAKIEIIYGLLWCVEVDTQTVQGAAVSMARKTALEMIDKDGQARGISIAKRAVQHKVLSAIPSTPTVSPRAGND